MRAAPSERKIPSAPLVAQSLSTAWLALLVAGPFGCSTGQVYPREQAVSSPIPSFDDSPICLRHGVRTRSRVDYVAGFDFYEESYQWVCPAGHQTSEPSVVDAALRHLERQGVQFVQSFGHSREAGWYAGPAADGGLAGWNQLVRPTVVVLAVNPSVVAIIEATIQWHEEFDYDRTGDNAPNRPSIWLSKGLVDGTRLPLPEAKSGWVKVITVSVIGEDGLPTIDASVPGELTHAGITVSWSHVAPTGSTDQWLDFAVSKAPAD